MHYLIITKLENSTTVSLKVKGLRENELSKVIKILTERNIKHDKIITSYLEADLTGVEMLNLLAEEFGYKVVSQAMAMEHSSLGGRDFQIEKVVWTLVVEDAPIKELIETDTQNNHNSQQ